MQYYLRMNNDPLRDATPYSCLTKAKAAFRKAFHASAWSGERTEASIHIAESIETANDRPDYLLFRGTRGGVKIVAM